MTAGKRIKAARISKGVTQAELAKKMFVTPSTIANWEQGRRNPKEETTQRIADALDVDISTLRKSYAVDGNRLCNTLGKEAIQDIIRGSNDLEKMNYYRLKFAEYLPQLNEEGLSHLVAFMGYLVATSKKGGTAAGEDRSTKRGSIGNKDPDQA